MLAPTQLGTLLLFHVLLSGKQKCRLLLKHRDQDIIFSPATSGILTDWGRIGAALAEPISGRSLPPLARREKQRRTWGAADALTAAWLQFHACTSPLIYGAAHFQIHLLQEEELQLDVNNRVLCLLKQSLLLSGVGKGGDDSEEKYSSFLWMGLEMNCVARELVHFVLKKKKM